MQFVLVAVKEACEEANIFESNIDANRLGVYIGTTTAGHVSAYEQAKRHFAGEHFSLNNLYQCTPGAWPLVIAKYIKANGPVKSFCISCSAGGESIGNAYRDIQDGIADIIVAGGGDAPISKINFLSFHLIKATSKWKGDPSEACQPYSKNRSGMVFGEGAGVVVLESLEHALNRGVTILGEIVNYVANTDGFHIVAPEPAAIRYGEVIDWAIKSSNISPQDIGYISCHGTGTPKNDAAETKAIKNAFGSQAYNLKLSSIKSMIGHAFGGSTALEVISLIKSLSEGIAPPTINYKEFDEECDLDCIPNVSAVINTDFGLKIATGFGGSNNALILKKIS
ncbi:putative beta-ketoacyl-acyl-carrier-protein synthase II [Ostertagia ostertagi]